MLEWVGLRGGREFHMTNNTHSLSAMLVESGEVVAIDRDGLWVETRQQSACDVCRVRAGCGTKLIADSLLANSTLVKAQHNGQASSECWSLGDRVRIEIDGRALVLGAMLCYLAPLCVMVAAVLVASACNLSEAMVLVSSLVGLGLGASLVKAHSRLNHSNRFYHASVRDKG